MAIALAALREASRRTGRPVARSLQEARTIGVKGVFLCHSHHDDTLAQGLAVLLSEAGWLAYIDRNDVQMPSTPDRTTATRIQQKIVELELFLFLATPNSMDSRWCPWELGYANGKKTIDNIIVCPTSDAGTIHGSEYLELYRRLDFSNADTLAVWSPGDRTNGIAVNSI